MAQRRATISDIALRAGVSVGTVSNVFNGKGRFAEDTRDRVLKAARDLHFTPNALIRSLQSGRTHTIGVFTWAVPFNTSRDISLLLLKGIMDGVTVADCDTLLYSRHPHEDEVTASFFLDRRVDGLILGPGGLSADGLQALAKAKLPTVAMYQGDVPDGIGAVNIDNVAGVTAAIQHLAALGHHRIAFYSSLHTFDFSERLRGYHAGLEQAGLPYDAALHVTSNTMLYREGMDEICDYLLALPCPPTAIIACDDSAAFALLEVLTGRGLNVPSDMSVIGFDDAPAASSSPGLTTIRQSAEQVGRLAAEFVQRILCGEPVSTCRRTLPVEFIVRHTTAPPRGRSAN